MNAGLINLFIGRDTRYILSSNKVEQRSESVVKEGQPQCVVDVERITYSWFTPGDVG